MAKKKKKSAKGGKSGKKSGKKGGKGKKASLDPRPVTTGKGTGVAEIASDFVAMFNGNAGDQAIWDKWFSKKLVSIEGHGLKWEGMKAVKAKNEWFMANNTVHSARAEGPYIGATGFAVRFIADIENKQTGDRQEMSEIAVYSVKNGKVVQEEFMGFGPPRPEHDAGA